MTSLRGIKFGLVLSRFTTAFLLIIRPTKAFVDPMVTLDTAPMQCDQGSCAMSDTDTDMESENLFDQSKSVPETERFILEDDNYCKNNRTYVWCLPLDYNMEKHPFTYSHLINKSLPWNYDFKFVVEEISNVNDKAQTMSISMYFGVSWLDPRLKINSSASEWSEARTGPKNEVNISPGSLRYIWYPELEIYGLEKFGRQRVLKEMSGVRIRKNKTIHYELGVRITISCRMMFDDYPLDAHTCQFQVGSYYDSNKTVQCSSSYVYDQIRQRSLQHYITFEELPEKDRSVVLPSGTYAACGFQIQLVRKQMQYLVQVYLPSCMFVVTSWVSFLIKPEVVPGRMALLVTLFLVLINIFNSVRERAPISSKLNAIDLYLVVCIFLVFGALMEYAVILLLLKQRRKPKRSIDSGLRKMFNNGEAQPLQGGSTNFEAGRPTPQKKRIESRDELQSPPKNQIANYDTPVDPHVYAICDNIDAWAMWLSPPSFVVFNIAYWMAYQHVEVDPPETTPLL
ncbi:gamma-aminobutyric acid receptor subunit pi isoform X4 [Lepeophtheirus salmonis]|uniref:gamma-aminobutyric acid receptor subunit pi isoform X4 n=1 Tax=Lepeophtheirus salmonis TaxID=72036 RepID=UPI001AEA55B1|nr:gamma-aminobutyric acid receptor subunit pi-like isoform X4 [Lepeophtheirus salmonis]